MPSGQLLIQFIGWSLQEQIWFRQLRNLKKIVGEFSDAALLWANACFAQKAQTLRESAQHIEGKLGKTQEKQSRTTGTTDALRRAKASKCVLCPLHGTGNVRQPGKDPEEGFDENLVGHRWLDRQRCCGR
jgi:hypothetical protein